MKEQERDWIQRIGELSFSEEAATMQKIQETYTGVLEKCGLTPSFKKRFPKRKLFLLAAALILIVGLVAATYYSVSDSFSGVLWEVDKTGETVPLQNTAPLLERAGTVAGVHDTQGDITVSLRSVITDGAYYRLLLDVEGPKDKPLAIKQPDGSYSEMGLTFGDAGFYFGDQKSEIPMNSNCRYSFLEGEDPLDNKATVYLELSNDLQPDANEKNITFLFQDLTQTATLDGTDPGMQAENMLELFTKLSPSISVAEKGEFEIGSKQENTGIPFAKTANMTLCYAAYRNNTLTLYGNIEPDRKFMRQFSTAALRNQKTGKIYRTIPGYTINIENGSAGESIKEMNWEAVFEGIPAGEQLEDLEFLMNAGEGLYILQNGTWTLQVPFAELENASQSITLNQPFKYAGYSFTAKKMTRSLFSVTLEVAYTPEIGIQIQEDDSDWLSSEQTMTIHRKNGSDIQLEAREQSFGTDQATMRFSIDDVILNPDEIVSVSFGTLSVAFPN